MLHTKLKSITVTATAAAVAATAGVLVGAAPAVAAQTTGWATWSPISGSANDYTSAVQLPGLGFPRATVATDSRGPAQLPGGTSTFLGGPGDSVPTPVGAKYGSSKGHQYLNLHPVADTPTTPSSTTYTFDEPAPATGWTFVLGDVDADQVHVRATDAVGKPVSDAVIDTWFRGVFNYAGDADLPRWDAGTATLVGNPAAHDTNGASGWFEPSVSLSSLTFVFTRRAGFPVYQTWFAATARTVSGTLTDMSGGTDKCSLADATVRLIGPSGTELATTHPSAAGAYSFGQVATQDGYTVAVDPPTGCTTIGSDQRSVNTSSADATADFQVRRIIPEAVSGTVTANGKPVAGVQITLNPQGGGQAKTTDTDEQGRYLIDDNADGGYTVTVTPPPGYTVDGSATHNITIAGAPVTDQNFTLVEQPTISGTITGGGGPLGGVTVTLTSTTGPPQTTSTRGDGSYEFVHVPSRHRYSISVAPPPGYRAPLSREISVGTTDVTGADFDLDRPGALGGAVTDKAGHRLTDVTISVHGPNGTRNLTTDADGNYFVDGLAAGRYTITPRPGRGYRASTPTERTVTITAAGEIRGGVDFTLIRGMATTAPSSGSPSTPGPGGAPNSGPDGPGGQQLADTGAPVPTGLAFAVLLMSLGMVFVVAGRRRTRARHSA